MRMKHVWMIVVSCVIAIACDTTTPSNTAEKLLLDDLSKNPGFSWFQGEVVAYSPNAAMVAQLAGSYSADKKVCVFVRPSCGCRGTQKLFPRVMKTLMEAKVDMSTVEIWGMRDPSDESPYKSTLNLTTLPTISVFTNGKETARIVDSDYNELNADTLIAVAVSQ